MRKTITILSLFAIVLGLSFTACTDSEANYKALVAQEWGMEKIVFTDDRAEIIAPSNVFIVFTDSLSVHGRGGCNNFMGAYKKIDNKTIELGRVASTMMLCPEMEFENQFFQLIEKVTTFNATEKGLELSDKEGTFKFVYAPRVIPAVDIEPIQAAEVDAMSEEGARIMKIIEEIIE